MRNCRELLGPHFNVHFGHGFGHGSVTVLGTITGMPLYPLVAMFFEVKCLFYKLNMSICPPWSLSVPNVLCATLELAT